MRMILFALCILGIVDASEWKPQTIMTPKYLYRIVSPEEWQKSQEKQQVETSSLDEKFIHLATKDQVPHIVQKFWKNKDYVLLTLDSSKLIGRLVYETNPGGTTLYYHLYEGKIPLEAVVDASIVYH